MGAIVIDGRAVARISREKTAGRVRKFVDEYGFVPGLATILVGGDPASEVYVRNKRKAATEAGFLDFHRHLDASASAHEVEATIAYDKKRILRPSSMYGSGWVSMPRQYS